MKKVSIITVVFNIIKNDGKDFFKQMFDSVHNQTYQNIEHIIIDGASTDGTTQFIQSLIPTAQKEIKFFSEPDSGIYNAMNKGIAKSCGDYIHFLNDSDHYENDDLISEVMMAAEDCQSDFIIGDVILVHLDERHTYRSNENINAYTTFSDWIYHVALFQRRDLFIKYGLFDENYKICADSAWFIPLFLDKKITKSYLKKPVARFRLDGISAREDSRRQTIAELEIILAKNFKGINNFFRKILQDRVMNVHSSPLIKFLNQKIRKLGFKKIILNFLLKKESWKIIYYDRYPKIPNKRIVFIGHSYHKKTKSSQFIIDYLSQFYDIDIYFDDHWNGGQKLNYIDIFDKNYKAIIFWQIIPDKEIIQIINKQNVVIFPMYDSYRNVFDLYHLKNTKIINFSSLLHKALHKFGFNSYYLQYFPEPRDFFPGEIDEVFFWQRRNEFNVNHVLEILKNIDYKLHIHKATDHNHQFIPPLNSPKNIIQITYSDWLYRKDELQRIIMKKAIYIAPRFKEGIGMSFLEVMAMGKVVIANNESTMNEYIVDGKTGFLCNYKNPTPININNIRQIQESTYEYMQQGYKQFLKRRSKIIEIIENRQPNDTANIYAIINLSMHYLCYKLLRLSKNIICWFILDKEKKNKIRGRI